MTNAEVRAASEGDAFAVELASVRRDLTAAERRAATVEAAYKAASAEA